MGCAGSKPHHLLSSSIKDHHHHHANSPQKGFILFNAKTIEYLKANESEIKLKLVDRCDQKLLKSIPQSASSKSLLSNARRTLLSSSSQHSNMIDPSLPSSPSSSKETSIDSAVDYVLKYAINDFDIENFKSSNHLSMKQIRKDIMKKNSSSSKLNISLSTSNTNGALTTSNHPSKTQTLNSKDFKDFTLANKASSSGFYKQALNTAIDEFGLFIQENFIVINEFDAKKFENNPIIVEELVETQKQEDTPEITEPPVEIPACTTDEEELKLKEALELARQNFYKGKMSMVCLNKKGGYVVKEVKEQTDDLVVVQSWTSDSQSASSSSRFQVTPSIKIEDVDNFTKSVSNVSVKSLQIEKSGNDAINEFLSVKNDLGQLLNETIELIVKYSTKSVNSQEITEIDPMIDNLIENLEKSKNVIEILKLIEEKDFDLIDEKLVQSSLNLDYVNKEFKTYLLILEDSLQEQIKVNSEEIVQTLSNKNKEIIRNVDQIDTLISNLPKKLFTSKALPHPTDANQTTSTDTPIDIKKEIAFSILNVGEVLAKTIDYYSLDSKSGHPEELNELIKISENQGSMHININTPLSSPSVSSSSSISPVQDPIKRKDSIKEDIAYLVEEMSVNMNTQINYLDEYERHQAKLKDHNTEVIHHLVDSSCILENKLDTEPKSCSSSSDILSSNNDDVSNMLVQEFISNIIESATHKLEENTSAFQKRMSLDEELLYQLEEVDKKVKYMNETCSENEGDEDDLDDENFDYDESVEFENANDERLFHPRRPAKIKSDLRQNRAIDLHEEIKQISNVIQDLVQTINVRNNGSVDEINLKNDADSEDGSVTRKSVGSRRSGAFSNSSNIPIRQKVLTKQRATSVEDEMAESFKTAESESFADFAGSGDQNVNHGTPEFGLNKSQSNNKTSSSSSIRFRSRLPVKK